MQIISSKNHIVEKVIRDKQGRLVRATFCVYENGGRIKARLVDFVYLTAGALKGSVLALTGFSKKESSIFAQYINKEIVSPFLTSEILYSSGSKPRAPTI